MSSSPQILPPRLETLRTQLLANIPALPGAGGKLATLSLPQTMLVYVNWAVRFIKPRPRSVSYAPGFWKTKAALERGGDVLALETDIKAGANLIPYLSGRVFTDGYWSPSDVEGERRSKWTDKDFALNAYGIHHLHFSRTNGRSRGAEPGKNGHLLYAEFTRGDATFLMVGDHKSFDDGTLHDALIEARAAAGTFELVGIRPSRDPADHNDQFRLARRGLATTGIKDGRLFVGAFLSTAGTSPHHSRHASLILRALAQIDGKLDDASYCKELFTEAGIAPPVAPGFAWHIEYTELSVVEHQSKTKFIIVDGLN